MKRPTSDSYYYDYIPFTGVTALNAYKTKHLMSFGGVTAPQIYNAVRYGILNQQHHARHTVH